MTDHWLPATDTAKYSPPDQLFLLERAPGLRVRYHFIRHSLRQLRAGIGQEIPVLIQKQEAGILRSAARREKTAGECAAQ